MAVHYIEYCRICNKVIAQCRCPDKNKEVRWSLCDDCNPILKKLSVAACCGSCKSFEFSYAYEESYCNVHKRDVSFAMICDGYELDDALIVRPFGDGFVLWDKTDGDD